MTKTIKKTSKWGLYFDGLLEIDRKETTLQYPLNVRQFKRLYSACASWFPSACLAIHLLIFYNAEKIILKKLHFQKIVLTINQRT